MYQGKVFEPKGEGEGFDDLEVMKRVISLSKVIAGGKGIGSYELRGGIHLA